MTKREIKKLDLLWSKAIKIRDKFSCQYCFRTNEEVRVESAHIFGRINRSTRWDLENGVCLCHDCHRNYDEHLRLHDEIVEHAIGKESWNNLKNKKAVIAKNQDFTLIKNYLELNTKIFEEQNGLI